MITRELLRKMSRLAAKVARYHCWPTITQQTIGDHSFNMLRIWWLIWGEIPPQVSTYIIWHDMGEYATGDSPFPFKANNPEAKAIIDAAEALAVEGMGGPAIGDAKLGRRHKMQVKICDLLEMMEFGMDEFILGNRYALPIIQDTRKAALDLITELQIHISSPDDMLGVQAGDRAVRYVNQRDREFEQITGVML